MIYSGGPPMPTHQPIVRVFPKQGGWYAEGFWLSGSNMVAHVFLACPLQMSFLKIRQMGNFALFSTLNAPFSNCIPKTNHPTRYSYRDWAVSNTPQDIQEVAKK